MMSELTQPTYHIPNFQQEIILEDLKEETASSLQQILLVLGTGWINLPIYCMRSMMAHAILPLIRADLQKV